MLAKFRNLLGLASAPTPRSIPSGERVYAIGDIHGRIDLFDSLIRLIEADDAARSPARTTVILLGDLIDRGPGSAAVVARARDWGQSRTVEYILGNHEEMLLASRHGIDALRGFLQFGGSETIGSYGVSAEAISAASFEELQALMNAAIPRNDIAFLESFKTMVRIGDYVFVHAGIRPGTPIEAQTGSDCRWIREPFLSHRGDYGACIVHGHTIMREPDVRPNRIGIDTGAYRHGTLTAIGLEGTERWFLQAHGDAAERNAEAAA